MIKLVIVMDPITSINIKKDSSFAMLLEAQKRGYEIHYMEMNDLYLRAVEGRARTSLLIVEQNVNQWFAFGDEQD
ncbi:glutathione synthase, partial [Erwinia amylovora]|nr:glutathione synthase [Erwinia amylovora]